MCRYLEDKLPILVDVNTKPEDRLHITVVVNFYFEEAIRDGQSFEELSSDVAVAKQAKSKATSSTTPISRLLELIKRAARKFWGLVSGLLRRN
jgi:hypothetical protein